MATDLRDFASKLENSTTKESFFKSCETTISNSRSIIISWFSTILVLSIVLLRHLLPHIYDGKLHQFTVKNLNRLQKD